MSAHNLAIFFFFVLLLTSTPSRCFQCARPTPGGRGRFDRNNRGHSARDVELTLRGFLGIGGGNDNNSKQQSSTNVAPSVIDPVVLINNVPTVAAGQLSTVTLTRYLSSLVASDETLREMEGLILSVAMACKTISTLVNRAGINNLTGLETDVMGTRSGTQTPTGKRKRKEEKVRASKRMQRQVFSPPWLTRPSRSPRSRKTCRGRTLRSWTSSPTGFSRMPFASRAR